MIATGIIMALLNIVTVIYFSRFKFSHDRVTIYKLIARVILSHMHIHTRSMLVETKEGIYFSAFDNRLFTFDKSIDIGINASRCLNLLIENKDCVVSKDQILQICWVANGIYVSDASIRQTIVKLRKAFSEVGLYGEYIKTIPKIGYRYSGDIIPVNKGDECPALSCETSSLNSENVPLHRPPGSATKKKRGYLIQPE